MFIIFAKNIFHMGETFTDILCQIVASVISIGFILAMIVFIMELFYLTFFYDAKKEAKKEAMEDVDRIIQELIDTNDERMAQFKADVAEMEAQKAREALEKPKQVE